MALKILIESLRGANSVIKQCDQVDEELKVEQLDIDQKQMDLQARQSENDEKRSEAETQKKQIRLGISDAMEESGSKINEILGVEPDHGLYCAYNVGDNSLEIREQEPENDTLLITLELYSDGLRAKEGESFRVPSTPEAQMFFFVNMPNILSV